MNTGRDDECDEWTPDEKSLITDDSTKGSGRAGECRRRCRRRPDTQCINPHLDNRMNCLHLMTRRPSPSPPSPPHYLSSRSPDDIHYL